MIENFYSDFTDETPEVFQPKTHAPFAPSNDFILVKRVEEDNSVTKGGIVIAEQWQQPSNRGTVLSLGHKVTGPVQEGDIITFGSANIEFLEINDEQCILLRENDVRGYEKAL